MADHRGGFHCSREQMHPEYFRPAARRWQTISAVKFEELADMGYKMMHVSLVAMPS